MLQHAGHLKNVYDAEVQDNVLGLRAGLVTRWECCGHHVHAQLHPLLPHAVADLVRRARAERHRPALACTFSVHNVNFISTSHCCKQAGRQRGRHLASGGCRPLLNGDAKMIMSRHLHSTIMLKQLAPGFALVTHGCSRNRDTVSGSPI